MAHVLQVQGYNRRGGSERHTAILSRGLAERGWRVTVATPPGGVLNDPGVLGDSSILPVSLSGRCDIGSIARLVRFCRTERVDIVHTHCRNADLLGGIAARIARVPLITTIHGLFLDGNGNRGSDPVNRVYRGFLTRAPDLLIGISESVSRNARQVLGISDRGIVTVLNGSDPPTQEERSIRDRLSSSLRRKPGEILVVQAGALEPSKGVGTLLEAVIRLVRQGLPVRLVFVGSGSLEKEIRQTASEAGVSDRVDVLGTVPNAGPYLGAADIVCLASYWEGFGRVLTEAMSYGKPVVASRIGGISEIVSHERTGFLVEPKSTEEWSDALGRLVLDEHLRERLGRRGSERFESVFQADRFVEETEELILATLRRRQKTKSLGEGSTSLGARAVG